MAKKKKKVTARTHTEAERFAQIEQVVQKKKKALSQQGSVIATYRTYQGHKLGPYYRVAYREKGKQRSIYLGQSKTLAKKVSQLIEKLQKEAAKAAS